MTVGLPIEGIGILIALDVILPGMSGWTVLDLLPGLYVLLLGAGLAVLLRRWYDPIPWRILAVFGLLLTVLFGKVLFGGGVLLPFGNLVGFYPFRQLPRMYEEG